jgi:hypothetical protein
LVQSHDLLEDRRTELRHTKPYPIAFPYLYRSSWYSIGRSRDICKIRHFQIYLFNSGVFFLLYKTNRSDFAIVCSVIDTQHDVIMWEEQKSDKLALGTSRHFLRSSHITTSYCLSITEQRQNLIYLLNNSLSELNGIIQKCRITMYVGLVARGAQYVNRRRYMYP